METFKKYLPLIVIAIVGYFLIRKVSQSSSGNITTNLTTVTPLTQAAGQPLTDPLLPYRGQGFAQLASVAQADIQGRTALQQSQLSADVQRQSIAAGLQQSLANTAAGLQSQLQGYGSAERIAGIQGGVSTTNAGTQAELAKYLQNAQNSQQQFLQNSYLRQLELYYNQRSNDIASQSAAIQRSQQAANQASIANSILGAIGRIFQPAQSSGNVYGTPPTFPSLGGLFGGSSGGNSGGYTTPPFIDPGYSSFPVLSPPDTGIYPSDTENPYLSGGYGGSGIPDYGIFNNGFSAFFNPSNPADFFV